jgi:two-component system sensor histidine kinase BaeS
MMNTVFMRILLPVFLTFLFLMLVLWIIFYTGLGLSIANWDQEQKENLSMKLASLLSDMFTNQDTPAYDEIFAIAQTLLPEQGFLVVVDRLKNPIFAFRNNQPGSSQDNLLKWAQNYMTRHKKDIVYFDLKPVGFFFFGETGFNKNQGSRKLVSAINLTFTWGILLSAMLSFLFAFLFSRSISKQTIKLMKGIEEIAAGNLEYRIKETGPGEFAIIAQSANSLGKKLKTERELRSQWTQDITHDLRTPLSALKAQLEGIRDHVLDPGPDRLSMILEELGRIEILVNDFNQLMKLESPEITLKGEIINAHDFLEELVRVFDMSAREKSVIITTNTEISEFSGDRHLLIRALSNLISNAIQYTDTGGTVRIEISRENGRNVLSVFNTGKAIPARKLPFVFDRLYRGDYARSTKGSGLGLSITKQIAELHNGSVGITSKEGRGTTVFFTLPGHIS